MSDSSDAITEMSQLAGGPALDAPRVFSKEPPPPNPLLQFDGSSLYMSDDPPAKKKPKPKYIPRARVFVIGEGGNPDYESLLEKGANGKVILGRKEVTDIRGSVSYKVYQEWIETSEVEAKETGKSNT